VTPALTNIAFDNIPPGAWEDATMMLGYEGGGRSIRVQENGKDNLELRVIP
jgi:hypothetical protein